MRSQWLHHTAISLNASTSICSNKAKVNDGKDGDGNDVFHYRVDALWYFIPQLKLPGNSNYRFKYLPLVTEVVLIIFRIVTLDKRDLLCVVGKNKTESRSLKLDGRYVQNSGHEVPQSRVYISLSQMEA